MKIHDIAQGSPEWHALRASHFTASEAPAMMGVSKYQTRNALLAQKATGASDDVDASTQALFDRGHAAEAAARPIAEKIIGDELYPATVSEEIDGLSLLASLDGMTMAGDTLFEHKLWNAELAAIVRDCGLLGSIADFPLHYIMQLEQQLLVTDAEKVLFMVSDGTEDRCEWMWYRSNPGHRQHLLNGWKQFEADVANYQHVEAVPAVVGQAPKSLPALRIEVTGAVTASNLAEFKASALAVIDGVNTNLQTDEDFANAAEAVKWCGDVETRIDAAKAHALSQTQTIDELFRTLDEIKEYARAKRLNLDKLVKTRKESVRVEIQQAAVADLRAHYDQINATLSPCSLTFPGDFAQTVANAMKGKKTVASLRDAASTAAAHAKIAASQIAERTRGNLKYMAERQGYAHLFADLNTLATGKAEDDFAAIVETRIAQHKDKIAREAEEQRERIRAEEQRKAEQALEAERARDAAARIEAERKAAPAEQPIPLAAEEPPTPSPAVTSAPAPRRVAVSSSKPTRPSDAQIIGVLALYYRVHESKVIEWLLDIDLHAESEKLAANQ